MNIPGFSSASRSALTLAYAAAAALLAIIVLLFAKGGDSSFFAGAILSAAGFICASVSLGMAAHALRGLQDRTPERYRLIACIVFDFLYIALTLLSLGFAALLFCAFRH
mgnify:CR=1 FL=1